VKRRVTEAALLQLLAGSAGRLAGGAAPERIVADVRASLGVPCRIGADGVPQIDFTDPTPAEQAFAESLAHLVSFAAAANMAPAGGMLDQHGFLSELERAVSAARWRAQDLSLAVLAVDGVRLGPNVERTDVIARAGELVRGCIRGHDAVGYLGAGQFAVLLPGAGALEARIVMRRVRDALAGDPALGCSPPGLADMRDGGHGQELLNAARERLAEARRRRFRLAPVDPTSPLAG
jgi:GGDEF domain-containing protein